MMVEKKTKTTNLLEAFEQRQKKTKVPELRSGDTVKVYAKIKEGDKERVQVFEGIVTRVTKGNQRMMVTVRKISFGVGVERMFPVYSPTIERIERLSRGRVRRARLYYLRQKKGKASRIESELAEQGASVIESLGTVASGPVISSENAKDEKNSAKKASAAEALNIQKG